ncbi:UNVERIFIED_CONTAM: hypothetical protein FKN15_012872 [Acipenser sinensis]
MGIVSKTQQHIKQYGKIFKSHFGPQFVVSIADKDMVAQVLRAESEAPQRANMESWKEYRDLRGRATGLISAEGQDWLKMRSVLRQKIMKPKDVAVFSSDVNAVVTDLIKRIHSLRSQAADGETVNNINDLYFKYAMEGVASILYEARLGCLQSEIPQQSLEYIAALHLMFSMFKTTMYAGAIPKWLRIIIPKPWIEFCNSWDGLFKFSQIHVDKKLSEIQAQLDAGEEVEGGLLTHLLVSKEMTVEEIYANMTEMLLAGVDTCFTDKQQHAKQFGEKDIRCEGQDWLKMRSVLRQKIMKPKDVAVFSSDVNAVVTDLIKRIHSLRSQAADGETVNNINDLYFKYAMEGVASILYEARLGCLQSEIPQQSLEYIAALHLMFSMFKTTMYAGAIPKWLRIIIPKPWIEFCNSWDGLFKFSQIHVDKKLSEIQAQLDAGEEVEGGLLTHLLVSKEMTVEEIYANMTEMLLAGVDTTSFTLSWSSYLLARHPQVQQAVYDEVVRNLGRYQAPIAEDISQLPLIRGVVKETALLVLPVCDALHNSTQKAQLDDGEEVEGGLLTHLLVSKEMTVEEIYANMTEMLLAGVDTTSFTLSWSSYLLARHPQVQQAVYDEVVRNLGRYQAPIAEDISQLPLIRGVVKETLRLFPVLPGNGRVMHEDMVVGGYLIPKGTQLALCHYSTSYEDECFPAALEFRPERWVRKDNMDRVDNFGSIPFGYGIRSCIGKRIAELELHLALVQTQLALCHYSTSYEDECFPAALEFRPERWVRKDNMDRVDNFGSIPFGYGIRSCIGKRIAELELHLALVQVNADIITSAGK